MIQKILYLTITISITFAKSASGQTSSIGSELLSTITHRSPDPNEYLKRLNRFETYVSQLNKEEQFLFIEELSTVYGCEVHDFERALNKIEWFRSQFLKSTEHNSYCEYLRGKIYLCAPDQSSNALIALENALDEKLTNNSFERSDLNTANLYSSALTIEGKYYKSLKVQQRILSEIITPNKFNATDSYLQFAALFSKLGKVDSCLAYLYKAYGTANSENNDASLSLSAYELGMFLRFTKEKKEALHFLLKSYNRILFLEEPSKRVKLCKVIGELYKLDNNSENALKFKEQELKYVDSLKTIEKSRQDAEYAYALNLKRERQIQTQNAFINVSNRIKWGIFVGIVLLFLLIFFWIRNKRKQSNSTNSSSIEAIVQQLKDPDSELPVEKEKILNELISDLQNSVSSQKWDDFENEFIAKNTYFLVKLDEKHPKLSSNERKLCMCLCQNLTTKEISPLTGQNAHAINIARGRLRKKLGIDHQEIPLPEYLGRFL